MILYYFIWNPLLRHTSSLLTNISYHVQNLQHTIKPGIPVIRLFCLIHYKKRKFRLSLPPGYVCVFLISRSYAFHEVKFIKGLIFVVTHPTPIGRSGLPQINLTNNFRTLTSLVYNRFTTSKHRQLRPQNIMKTLNQHDDFHLLCHLYIQWNWI